MKKVYLMCVLFIALVGFATSCSMNQSQNSPPNNTLQETTTPSISSTPLVSSMQSSANNPQKTSTPSPKPNEAKLPDEAVKNMINAANKDDGASFIAYLAPYSMMYNGANNLLERLPPLDKKKMYVAMFMPAEFDHFVVLSTKTKQQGKDMAIVTAKCEVWCGFDANIHKAGMLPLDFHLIKIDSKWYVSEIKDRDVWRMDLIYQ